MKHKKLLSIILASILSLGLLSGCGSSKNASNNTKGEDKHLTIYCGLMEDHMIKAVDEFEKETGIKVDAVRMSSGEIIGRIKAEKANPKASVWFGGPADGFIQAKEDGLLEKYDSPNADKIPDKFKDSEGYWNGIYLGYLGFACNKTLLEQKGIQVPKSWEDLLDPKLKGQIIIANPGSSGTAYTCLATIVQLMGEEKGLEYMNKLNKQIKTYTKSGTAPGQLCGQGECMVGVTFLHDAILYKEQGMKDIEISAPKEGTGYEIGGVAIIKNGPDGEAAKKFVDWALTKKAQEIGQTVGSYQFLTNADAVPPKQATQIKDTKLIDYDFQWAGKNRNALTAKWNDAIKK